MADQIEEVLYFIDGAGQGYDNRIKLVLTEDGAAADISAVTRVVVILGAVVIDSDVVGDADLIDWQTETDDDGNAIIVIDLEGKITAPTVVFAQLITYDATNVDGLVWFVARRIDGRTRLRVRAVTVAAAA